MFIPKDTEVKVRNGEVIPAALYTLARKWRDTLTEMGVPFAGSVEEFRAAVPNGTLGFSAEDAAVIQGVTGNGAKMFADALTEVTGVKWSPSDRIVSEEMRNPVKFAGTVAKGKKKGEKVEKVFTGVHRSSPREKTTKKTVGKKKTAAKTAGKKKTAAKK